MCQEPDPTDPGAHLVWWSKRSCESRLEFMCLYGQCSITLQSSFETFHKMLLYCACHIKTSPTLVLIGVTLGLISP